MFSGGRERVYLEQMSESDAEPCIDCGVYLE